MKGHRIENIVVIQENQNVYSKLGVLVVDDIIREQKTDVDAISGATNTAKCIQKAVERALKTSTKAYKDSSKEQ